MTINVEVFSSPGCGKCGHAKQILRKLSDDLNAKSGGNKIHWREVDILEEIDHAVELGVMSTPAIAIDGELVFASLPSSQRLRTELESRLESDGNSLVDTGSST